MTLTQIKTLIIGVLKGWFTNKKVLDKFSEDTNGKVLYNGNAISSGDTVEDSEVNTAITEILAALNSDSTS